MHRRARRRLVEWAILAVAVVVLVALIGRLVRGVEPPGAGASTETRGPAGTSTST